MKIPSNAYPIAIALCKEFEGFASAAYKFPGETWYTIGYGTVQIDDRPVPPGMVISEPEAAALLEAELRRRGDRLADIVRHSLNANQWAALLSLAYNVKGGVGAIAQSRMLLHLNRGDIAAAMAEWDWEHGDNGQKLPGLVRRRQRERELFLGDRQIQAMQAIAQAPIDLTDAAYWYKKQRHQDDAWRWLQGEIPAATLAAFADRYRTDPDPPPPKPEPTISAGTAIAVPGRGTLSTMDRIGTSQHFRWGEATKGGTRIPADAAIASNIERMAAKMDAVRRKLGDRPILVTSWYRPPAVNRAVGGATNSTHIQGYAVDFNVQGLSPGEVQRRLEDWPGGLGYGRSFTHLDDRGYRARWNYG